MATPVTDPSGEETGRIGEIAAANLPPDYVASLASHVADRLESGVAHAQEQAIRVAGWLSASLLAINGAGALATMNAGRTLSAPQIPGGIFTGGIVLALLSAVAIQAFIKAQTGPAEVLIRHFRDVAYVKIWNEDANVVARAPLERVRAWALVPQLIGWLSALCFIAGAFALGDSMRSHVQGERALCALLQRNMLSVSPTSDWSLQRYEALNCDGSE